MLVSHARYMRLYVWKDEHICTESNYVVNTPNVAIVYLKTTNFDSN